MHVEPGGQVLEAVHLRSQLVGGFLPVREMSHIGVTPLACTPAQVSQGGQPPGVPGLGICVQGGAQMQPFCVSRPPYSTWSARTEGVGGGGQPGEAATSAEQQRASPGPGAGWGSVGEWGGVRGDALQPTLGSP